MNKGFIKNEELLKETHQVDDLLDFSENISKFEKRLESLNRPSIVGLVGPFGSGKSTMLFQMEQKTKDKMKWINFDAWKYPDRKDLWEGFVLDFSKEISPSEFTSVDKKIKGAQNDDKKTLIKTLSRIPGFAVLEGVNHFFETSPARRVDEIQEIFKEQIQKADTDLCVVLEDIDRSGDAGVLFLETLKQFVAGLSRDKKFTVIVPISDASYYKNLESYLKSIDYFEFFVPENIKLGKFVEEIFDPELFTGELRNGGNRLVWSGPHRKAQIVSFLEGLYKEYPKMSMRLLKLILRKANIVYINQQNDGHEPDFRATICVEASKYFSVSNDSERMLFDEFKAKRSIDAGNLFSSFLVCMLANSGALYKTERNRHGEEVVTRENSHLSFKFIDRQNSDSMRYPSYPWQYHDMWSDTEKDAFAITSFYLNY